MRSATDFEEAAADWMRAWGHRSVRRTHAGRDGGIDVESIEAIAQVKAWMVPVGSPEIQQLKGAAYDGRIAIFFSLTAYTPAAIQFADQSGVLLFRFSSYNGEVEPASIGAVRFLTERSANSCPVIEDFSTNPVCELITQKLEHLVANDDSFLILRVKHAANRYIQAASGGEGALSVESVGSAHAQGPLTRIDLLRLEELGWPRCPKTDNYQILYPGPASADQISAIAELLARTLIDVHGATSTDDLDVTLDSFTSP